MCEGCASQKTAMGDRSLLGIKLSHLASPLPPPWIPDPPASISQELGVTGVYLLWGFSIPVPFGDI